MSSSLQPSPRLHGKPLGALARRLRRRSGGSAGNEVLTSVNAVVLALLLIVQGLTVLALDGMIQIHLFVGVVLLGPIALKLTSTGYKFVRYYSGAREYRLQGPPPTLLRVIAPIFVVATLGLFGSGVTMLLDGEASDTLLTLHVVSFWTWLACLAIHVAFNLREVVSRVRSEWLDHAKARLPGAELRAALLLGSLLGGFLLALSALSKITGWDAS